MIYLIQVLTLNNIIPNYKVNDCKNYKNLIYFTNLKTGIKKAFPTERTTIEEVLN